MGAGHRMPWPVMIGALLAGMEVAAGDPVSRSNRPADTYPGDEIRHYRLDDVAETYLFPPPKTCPRSPAGHVRWDLC